MRGTDPAPQGEPTEGRPPAMAAVAPAVAEAVERAALKAKAAIEEEKAIEMIDNRAIGLEVPAMAVATTVEGLEDRAVEIIEARRPAVALAEKRAAKGLLKTVHIIISLFHYLARPFINSFSIVY